MQSAAATTGLFEKLGFRPSMSLTFKKVRSASQSDGDAVKIELFRAADGRICAWFLGPVRFGTSGVSIPYLPRSKNVVASVAVVRAVEEAKTAKLAVCIVDPDDLWELAWAA